MNGSLALHLAGLTAHVLTGVYWVGGALVLARFGPLTGGQRLRRSQLLAATFAMLLGVWLWLGHSGEWSRPQARAMMLAALAAVVAAGVQSGFGLRASRQLDGPDDAGARRRLRVIDGTAASLLVVALMAMVLAHRF
jgi:uncharacterized membrane protein